MEYLIISTAALLASGLTLFSGFGLGTLLMPVFSLFFPVEVAVAQTAVVHLANNLFKAGLLGRRADWRVVLLFGLPAFAASFLGAALLLWLAHLQPLTSFTLAGRPLAVQPVKLVVALLMAVFALLDLRPATGRIAFARKYLPAGGVVSGFFGGLSGHQGAFRSAFLLRLNLDKEAFVATGVLIAVLVDFSRLSVYAGLLASPQVRGNLPLILTAVAAAFAGAFAGRRLLHKVTIRAVQITVAALLLLIALLLGLGLI